jgi:anti-sigma B factor antagonist
MESSLKIEILNPEKDKNYQIVKFEGEFDKIGYSSVKDDLKELLEKFPLQTVVFDFGKLKFINSEAIGYLMDIRAHLVKRDRNLIIVGLQDNIDDIFDTIGMKDVVPIYKDLAEFTKTKK